MKKYFYLIVIDVFYYPKGEEEHVNKIIKTQKKSEKGIIDIDAKNDKPSLIYDKVFEYVMNGWEDGSVIKTIVIYFNFWEEKETLEDSNLKTVIEIEKILNSPITGLDLNLATLEQLEKRGFKTCRDIVSMTEKDLQFLELSEMTICNIKEALSVYKLKLAK